MAENKSKKLKKYSFELTVPKGFKNDWIVVEAENPIEAKKELVKECMKLNERFMSVYEFDPIKEKLKQPF